MHPIFFFCHAGRRQRIILGNPALKLLGIDVYDKLGGERAAMYRPHRCRTATCRQCRRVIVIVDALEQLPCGTSEELGEAEERLVALGPDIDMSLQQELRVRSGALEKVVLASVAAGWDRWHVERLRGVIGRRWSAFGRGLRRGDPPERVEPLRVNLKPGARPVKAWPRVYNFAKTAWLAAYMASLAALGLVFLICKQRGPVPLWLRQTKRDFAW